MMSIRSPSMKSIAGQQRAVAVNSHSNRRAALASLFSGAGALTAGKALADATPVDLFDDRTVRNKGFDLIYEARDLDLPQNLRDGISQFRGDISATRKRFDASKSRITGTLNTMIEKQYWTDAREELRLQVGTFRQDMETLASSKGSKKERKAGLAKADDLMRAIEDLDFQFRKKSLPDAQAKYAVVQDKLQDFETSVLA